MRRFHYHDWQCVNHSNECLWFLVELLWYLILTKMFEHFALDQEFMTQESIPGWILPFRLIVLYFKREEYLGLVLVVVTLVSWIHSIAYLL